MVAPRRAVFAEEAAEVEVLSANMDKMKSLTKKIQGSLNRLDTSGKNVQDAIGPIYGNTQRLQVANANIDRIMEAIDKVRAPLDKNVREERIIRAGPRNMELRDYIASLDRVAVTLKDLRRSNLRSNQQAVDNYSNLLKFGAKSLEDVFRQLLREGARETVEPLGFIMKNNPFPTIESDKLSTLRLINTHISSSFEQLSQTDARQTPTQRIYAEIRGDYIRNSLANLAAATVTTARKTTADAIYKPGTNGIGTYAQGMEGLFLAEYDNICPIFARDEWGAVFTATCQSTLGEFTKTLRELNGHIQRNLMTDCFLGYEIIELVSNLSIRLETKTGELKRPIADTLKPIRETSKASLGKLIEDTTARIQTLVALPQDGAAVPITTDVMVRLQTMTSFLAPVSSILISLGDRGWTSANLNNASSSSLPMLKSFDVGADGRKLFQSYADDLIGALLSNLDAKAKTLLKGKSLQGVFIANNYAIISRMIQSSDLQPLLPGFTTKFEQKWRKKGTDAYLDAWRAPCQQLLDTQFTNRSGRPHSGGAGSADSAVIVKGLSSKDKDALKEKFKVFNGEFETLINQHKSYRLEREVRSKLAEDVQRLLEPLYGRFWDRYHEIDKGKGKYVKYDKSQLRAALDSLA
ncbi:Cullin repeat-like-containing domain protein [Clohesyomyces aquaticus]|uniref:Exocyst complex protein EXO70 n=1 Tax=Clohesyomyces aquaticus TaxID=1231657 RepID=A0A1Y2A2T2_9PLEO|nr:Cullin repeat-like-containing domain protein [Clohesyomyces aquaticus]